MLIDLQFPSSVLWSFLKTGLTFTYFKLVGKEELERELLKLRYTNRAVSPLFPLMIGTGMPAVWDAFFGLCLFISCKVCSNETNLKLNFGLFIFEISSLIQNYLNYTFHIFRHKLLSYPNINLKSALQNTGLLEKIDF